MATIQEQRRSVRNRTPMGGGAISGVINPPVMPTPSTDRAPGGIPEVGTDRVPPGPIGMPPIGPMPPVDPNARGAAPIRPWAGGVGGGIAPGGMIGGPMTPPTLPTAFRDRVDPNARQPGGGGMLPTGPMTPPGLPTGGMLGPRDPVRAGGIRNVRQKPMLERGFGGLGPY